MNKDTKYFHYSNETIFEIKLLKSLMADIMFKQTSIRGFTDANNYLNSNSNEDRRCRLTTQRLTDIFHCYELVKYHCENKLSEPLKREFYQIHFLDYFI